MISVCLACYNGEKYIKEQIASILVQLNNGDELLISDDGSVDETINIIKSFDDARIVLFQNKFRSHIKNFEFLLKQIKGDYVFLSDQDDIWVDNKVEVCMKHLQEYDLVLSDCILIDGNNNIIKDSLFGGTIPRSGFIRTFYKNIYTGCCMAFTKEIANNSLTFPEKLNSHDMWIGMIAELKGRVKVLDEKLIYFRRHGKNFSASIKDDTFLTGKSPYKINKILFDRFYMLVNLLKKF
ncbi:glycosyltransferase family 2 protein [Chryseobacterium sp.]|uniref:glycosyltransferase family 2 protein n=1 Tax=Chryseobacterium sp. TaxID=1871047 RepID=UPI00388CFE37